jgi:hypothetical protein
MLLIVYSLISMFLFRSSTQRDKRCHFRTIFLYFVELIYLDDRPFRFERDGHPSTLVSMDMPRAEIVELKHSVSPNRTSFSFFCKLQFELKSHG